MFEDGHQEEPARPPRDPSVLRDLGRLAVETPVSAAFGGMVGVMTGGGETGGLVGVIVFGVAAIGHTIHEAVQSRRQH